MIVSALTSPWRGCRGEVLQDMPRRERLLLAETPIPFRGGARGWRLAVSTSESPSAGLRSVPRGGPGGRVFAGGGGQWSGAESGARAGGELIPGVPRERPGLARGRPLRLPPTSAFLPRHLRVFAEVHQHSYRTGSIYSFILSVLFFLSIDMGVCPPASSANRLPSNFVRRQARLHLAGRP